MDPCFNVLPASVAKITRCCGPADCGRTVTEDALSAWPTSGPTKPKAPGRYCIADDCMGWAWRKPDDGHDYSRQELHYQEIADRRAKYTAAMAAHPPGTAEHDKASDDLANITSAEFLQDACTSWVPTPPRGWTVSGKSVIGQDIVATIQRRKDDHERYGFCGLRGRCAPEIS